jgi:hypothetical protein
MGTTPTVPTFLIALTAAIDAVVPCDVSLGWPGDDLGYECVWVAGCEGEYSIPTMKHGRKDRDESYEVKCFVDVVIDAGTQEEALVKAYDYFDVIEGLLADDPSLNGEVEAAVAGRFMTMIGVQDRASFCRIEFNIAVGARLT